MAASPVIIRHRYPQKTDRLVSDVFVINPVGELCKGRAIWDTGAVGCHITQEFADSLGLVPRGTRQIRRIQGIQTERWHRLRLAFISDLDPTLKFETERIKIGEFDSGGEGDVLIGMNIIKECDFSIKNTDQGTYFTVFLPGLHNSGLDSSTGYMEGYVAND